MSAFVILKSLSFAVFSRAMNWHDILTNSYSFVVVRIWKIRVNFMSGVFPSKPLLSVY